MYLPRLLITGLVLSLMAGCSSNRPQQPVPNFGLATPAKTDGELTLSPGDWVFYENRRTGEKGSFTFLNIDENYIIIAYTIDGQLKSAAAPDVTIRQSDSTISFKPKGRNIQKQEVILSYQSNGDHTVYTRSSSDIVNPPPTS